MATNLHGQTIPDWEVYCGKCGYTYPLNTAGPTQVCPQCRHYTMFRRDLLPKEETKQMSIEKKSVKAPVVMYGCLACHKTGPAPDYRNAQGEGFIQCLHCNVKSTDITTFTQTCDQCNETTHFLKAMDSYETTPILECPKCHARYDAEDWTYLGKSNDQLMSPPYGSLYDTTVQIKLEPNGKLPAKAHATDACYDCYANEDLTLYPGKAYAVSLGFALAIPEGWQAKVLPRSGLSLKGLRVLNAPGTIDSDFRGVVKALLKWEGMGYMDVHAGDRLVQMEFQRVPLVQLLQVDELDTTERGEGGFGSTGVK